MAKKTSTKTNKKGANKALRKTVKKAAKTAVKTLVKRATKKVAKRAAKPAPKSVARTAPTPIARPAARSTTKTTARASAQSVTKAVAKSVGQKRPGMPASTGREPWQDDLRDFIRKWRREHPHIPGTKGAKMTRTFLKITRTAQTHVEAAGLGQKHVPVLVQNLGNVAAFSCVVRALEARPRSPVHEKIPLSEFTLGGQLIFTLQPGEKKEIRIPYLRTRPNGTFVALISDPLLDPNELTVADMNHRRVLLFNLV